MPWWKLLLCVCFEWTKSNIRALLCCIFVLPDKFFFYSFCKCQWEMRWPAQYSFDCCNYSSVSQSTTQWTANASSVLRRLCLCVNRRLLSVSQVGKCHKLHVRKHFHIHSTAFHHLNSINRVMDAFTLSSGFELKISIGFIIECKWNEMVRTDLQGVLCVCVLCFKVRPAKQTVLRECRRTEQLFYHIRWNSHSSSGCILDLIPILLFCGRTQFFEVWGFSLISRMN